MKEEDTKRCSRCKSILPLSSYLKRGGKDTRLRSACIECSNKRRRELYKLVAKPDDQRAKNLKKDFGLTIQEYDDMLDKQGGTCKICLEKPKSRRLAVDHCHTTGVIRGLLCHHCNTGLGHFRDNPELLNKAINYLKETKDGD